MRYSSKNCDDLCASNLEPRVGHGEDDHDGVHQVPDPEATEFLESLDGKWAIERDRLRLAGFHDRKVADFIDQLDGEAAALRFKMTDIFDVSSSEIEASVITLDGELILESRRIDLFVAAQRRAYAESLAELHVGITADDAEHRLCCFAYTFAKSPHEISSEKSLSAAIQIEAESLAMLRDARLLERIIEDIHALGVAGEADLISTIYLAATSRLQAKPVSLIISSASGTGKSHVLSQTVSCFPGEEVIDVTSMTPNALFYAATDDPCALQHKLVVSGEKKKRRGPDQADSTSALRQLLSEGRVSKLATDTSTKPPTTKQFTVEGPIAYIETTTTVASDIFDEDRNRCLIVEADDSPQQTQRVVQLIAEEKACLKRSDREEIIKRQQASQRMLQHLPVLIPFAKSLSGKFPCHRPEATRAFRQLCGMIEASALLHQKQRVIDSEGWLYATIDDYDIAAKLCRQPLGRLLGVKTSNAAVRFYERLLKWSGRICIDDHGRPIGDFTTTEACRQDRRSDSAILSWLKELVAIGAVEQTQSRRGNHPAQWRLTGKLLSDVRSGGFDLPSKEDLLESSTGRTSETAL